MRCRHSVSRRDFELCQSSYDVVTRKRGSLFHASLMSRRNSLNLISQKINKLEKTAYNIRRCISETFGLRSNSSVSSRIIAVAVDHRRTVLVWMWPWVFHPSWSSFPSSLFRASPVMEYILSSMSRGKLMRQNLLLIRGGRPRNVARLMSIPYKQEKMRLRTSDRKKGALYSCWAFS